MRSWIDAPQPFHASAGGPQLWIRGWCYDENDRPIRRIRARIGTRVVQGVYGWQRGDVRLATGGPPSSAESGFGLAVFISPGPNRIVLEVEFPDLGWVEFARGEWNVAWSRYATAAAGRLLLRVAAMLHWRGPFVALTQPEREYVHLEMEQRARMPLRIIAHHAPRGLRREEFPPSRRPASRRPGFAIVTPSFRQAGFIETTLRSVLDDGGDGTRVRYAVMDGGSSDGTREILARWAPRLAHWRCEPDAGQADAVQRGFAALAGGGDEIMAYLNSDDVFMPGALAFVADYFAAHPETDVVFGHRVLIDEAGREIGRWATPKFAVVDLPWFDLIPQETMFWRRRIWDRVGGIDPSFQFALDWDLLLRFQAAGARFARLPYFLGLFRLHGAQKSQAQLAQVGIPEMERLRRRALGGEPDSGEMWWRMVRAQRDSARRLDRLNQGWRC